MNERMTKDDHDFIQMKNKKNSMPYNDRRGQLDSSNATKKKKNKHNKGGKFTSTPSKNNAPGSHNNSINLSPTQIEAIKYLGWNPSSDFVKNIVASQSHRG